MKRHGVLISGIDEDGAAVSSGLSRGMIIKRIIAASQRFDINNVDDFRRAERSLRSGMDVAVMVLVPNQAGEYNTRFFSSTIP